MEASKGIHHHIVSAATHTDPPTARPSRHIITVQSGMTLPLPCSAKEHKSQLFWMLNTKRVCVSVSGSDFMDFLLAAEAAALPHGGSATILFTDRSIKRRGLKIVQEAPEN